MHSATLAYPPDLNRVAIIFSVRDLVQWSLRFLRDPQALCSTLTLLRILHPRAFGSLKITLVLHVIAGRNTRLALDHLLTGTVTNVAPSLG